MHIRLDPPAAACPARARSRAVAQSPALDQTKYLLPPQDVVDAFDAPPLPQALLSPNSRCMALTYQHGRSPTSPSWRSRCCGSPARA